MKALNDFIESYVFLNALNGTQHRRRKISPNFIMPEFNRYESGDTVQRNKALHNNLELANGTAGRQVFCRFQQGTLGIETYSVANSGRLQNRVLE